MNFVISKLPGATILVAMVAVIALGCGNPTAPDTTPPTITISFPANGARLAGSVNIKTDANDNQGIGKVEFYVDGSLNSTVTSPAWEYMWDTRQAGNGEHTLFAKAYDNAGNSSSSAMLSVTVKNPYEHTFYNPLFTPIDLTVNGHSYVIPVGGERVVQFTDDPGTFHYYARTSGTTTQGTQVGLLIQWDFDVSTASTHSTELILSSDYFFLKIDNQGYSVGGPLDVNYGLYDETEDNISIQPGGLYNIGYYHAYTNTSVRMYLNGSGSYSYWDQGYQFWLPFTENQSVTLLNTYGTKRKDDPNGGIISSIRLEPLADAHKSTDTVKAMSCTLPAERKRDVGVARK